MTQLVLDAGGRNISLPESRKGGYRCDNTDLGVSLEMASGRMVREIRGHVYEVSYQYGFFDTADKNDVIEVCTRGQSEPISCMFLTPEGDMLTSQFFVTSFTRPKFMWGSNSADPVGLWGDYSFTLREVAPHD